MGRAVRDAFDRDRLSDHGRPFANFEYLAVEEKARTPSLILFAALILINVVWRAVGALAGRIEPMLQSTPIDDHGSKGGSHRCQRLERSLEQ
jgi:hypothetical protein